MSDALRDQLLKAGLVDEKRIKQARPPKQKRKGRGAPAPQPDAAQRAAAQARAAEAERARELNRKQQEAAERKAVAAQIRQIIDAHKLPRGEAADIAYAVQHGSKVRRVYVTAEQQRALVAGTLAVVSLAGGYELVPREAADKIRERDPGRVVAWNDPDAPKPPPASDDPYAGYEVPDDLMW